MFWLLCLNAVIKPFWIFFIDRKLQNDIGFQNYGTYFSLFNICLIFNFLLDWGFTQFFTKEVASNKTLEINFINHFFFTKLIFIAFFGVVVFCFGAILLKANLFLFSQIIGIQILSSIFLFSRAVVIAHHFYIADAWFSVIDKMLMIFICGCFLLNWNQQGSLNLNFFLNAQIISTIIAITIVFFYLYRRKIFIQPVYSIQFYKNNYKLALPYAMIVALMTIHNRADGFLLSKLSNDFNAGIYAAAYRLIDIANMVGYLMATFLMSLVAFRFFNKLNFSEIILQSRHIIILFSFFCVLIIFFYATQINFWLYPKADASLSQCLKICMITLPGYALVQIYGTVLTATGHLYKFCYITFWAVIINLILNIFLQPVFTIYGAALSAFVSEWFCGISCIILCRNLKLVENIFDKSYLKYVFIIFSMLCILFISNKIAFSPILAVTITAIFGLFITFQLKLIQLKSFNYIFKNSNHYD